MIKAGDFLTQANGHLQFEYVAQDLRGFVGLSLSGLMRLFGIVYIIFTKLTMLYTSLYMLRLEINICFKTTGIFGFHSPYHCCEC
jgi:hypothetical protein